MPLAQTQPGDILALLNLILLAIQTIILAVGIPLVLRQIQQQIQGTRLQNDTMQFTAYTQIMGDSARADDTLSTDSDLKDFYDDAKIPADLGDQWLTLSEKYRKYYLYLGRLLSVSEQAFVMWDRGWIDKVDYRACLFPLREIMQLKIFRLWWPALRPYYRQNFAELLDKLNKPLLLDNDTFFEDALREPHSKP